MRAPDPYVSAFAPANDVFVGEIVMYACNFAPDGYAECNGQLLPLSQNTALFSLLGTYYGGDGKSTFALPDLQGRIPVGAGQGAGLTERYLGESGGQESVTLTPDQLPNHTHVIKKVPLTLPIGTDSSTSNPVNGYPGVTASTPLYAKVAGNGTSGPLKASLTAMPLGSSQPVNDIQPSLTILFAIALSGTFPPRS
ncbi:phage tail protein [Chitinophaga sp. RAB17]|uniref:phage tail protein n=1 Tax=Chitinophaga sp. RAB17 TaxID=3233049 RepID=UPI003F92D55A